MAERDDKRQQPDPAKPPAEGEPDEKLTGDDADQFQGGEGAGVPEAERDQEWPMDSAWWGTLERPEYETDDGASGPLFDPDASAQPVDAPGPEADDE